MSVSDARAPLGVREARERVAEAFDLCPREWDKCGDCVPKWAALDAFEAACRQDADVERDSWWIAAIAQESAFVRRRLVKRVQTYAANSARSGLPSHGEPG